MSVHVVDTNVVLAANGQHANLSCECVATCALRLQGIVRNGKLALDAAFEILGEYQHKTQPKKGARPGDAFVKWALNHRANAERVDLIELKSHGRRGFESFPDDPRLTGFDDPDRKFVAVANAHPGKPAILQAADSKWIDWEAALAEHEVKIEFLCPDDIKRFYKKKFGS